MNKLVDGAASCEDIRREIFKQNRQILEQTTVWVTCSCGRKIGTNYSYKCLECGIRFCTECAKIHFTRKDSIVMNNEVLNELIQDTFQSVVALREKKVKEYSPGEDQLGNFKRTAALRAKQPEDALMGMLVKHWDSINQMVDQLTQGKIAPPAQWKAKLYDNILYSVLLLALVKERVDGPKSDQITT